MHTNSTNYWKRWTILGFFLGAGIHAAVCQWGDVTFFNELKLVFKMLFGLGQASVTAGLFGGLSATYHYCKKRIAGNKALRNLRQRAQSYANYQSMVRIGGDKPTYKSINHHIISSKVSPSPTLYNWRVHAEQCNRIVSDYLQACSAGTDAVYECHTLATELRQEQRGLSDSAYLIQLQSHGYLYENPPLETIVQFDQPELLVVENEHENSPVSSYTDSENSGGNISPKESFQPRKISFN